MVIKGEKVSVINQHPFFHRKLARSRSSRYLAVGKIVPEDWLIVRVEVKSITDKVCVLEITKLE